MGMRNEISSRRQEIVKIDGIGAELRHLLSLAVGPP